MMFHAVLLPSGGFKRKKGPQKRVRTSFLNNPMSPQLFLKHISQKETAVYKIVRDRQQYPRILIHICLNGPLKMYPLVTSSQEYPYLNRESVQHRGTTTLSFRVKGDRGNKFRKSGPGHDTERTVRLDTYCFPCSAAIT